MQEDQLSLRIEAEIQKAIGNLQVNNIVLSVKLEAAQARIVELEARQPLDVVAGVPVMDGAAPL